MFLAGGIHRAAEAFRFGISDFGISHSVNPNWGAIRWAGPPEWNGPGRGACDEAQAFEPLDHTVNGGWGDEKMLLNVSLGW